jgi:hypothetical protein
MAEVSRLTAISIVLVHGGFVDGSGWEGVYGGFCPTRRKGIFQPYPG